MVRARLRELPMIYILILGMATFWRGAVLRDDDLVLYTFDASSSRRSGESSPSSPADGPSRSPGSGRSSWG